MKRRSMAGLLGLVCLCAVGCQPMIVQNPRYDHWDNFKEGSSVTMKGRETIGEEIAEFQITDKLVKKGFSELVIERQLKGLDVDDNEPVEATSEIVVKRWIDPSEHPMTHPKAKITKHGKKTVTVGGKSMECNVVEIDVDGTFGELVKTPTDMDIDTLICEEIPGGVVSATLTNKTSDHHRALEVQAVSFEAK